MEMIVAILVFSLIMMATTTVFGPMMMAFRRANNLAEANTLLDNIAMFMLADINSAVNQVNHAHDPDDSASQPFINGVRYNAGGLDLFSYRHFEVRYTNSAYGIQRGFPGMAPAPLLEGRFFRYVEFYLYEFYPGDDVINLHLLLTHPDGWYRSRVYAIRPMGLQ